MSNPITILASTVTTSGLGYSNQNKVATLCDGSLIFADYDATASAKLWIVAAPSAASASASLVQTFTITSATQVNVDIFVQNSAGTSDVWICYSNNTTTAGTAGANIQHAVYTASGASWAWDAATSVTGASAVQANVGSVVWTGTYLIVAWRDEVAGPTYTVKLNYTTTKAGTGGWLATAIQLPSATNAASHQQCALAYDPVLGYTVAVYTFGATGSEQLTCRILPDGNTPALANWGAEQVIATTLNTASASFAIFLDPGTSLLHVVWTNTVASSISPGYSLGTVNVSAKTASFTAARQLGTQVNAAVSCGIGMDGSGTIWAVWNIAAVAANSVIRYVALPSPYTATVADTSLGTTTNDLVYPHFPNRERSNRGYMPLFYQYGISTFPVTYDNGLVAAIRPAPRVQLQAVNRAATY